MGVRCCVCGKQEPDEKTRFFRRCPRCSRAAWCSEACKRRGADSHREPCRLLRLEQGWDPMKPPPRHPQPEKLASGVPPRCQGVLEGWVPPGGWGSATLPGKGSSKGSSKSSVPK
mmetsp:Transcript_19968/g.65039  ORF Transcript_19968/g.65039 Transcript_19968/m.65039 type:complete len:115 (-) Transcript_19968:547-891(-)